MHVFWESYTTDPNQIKPDTFLVYDPVYCCGFQAKLDLRILH